MNAQVARLREIRREIGELLAEETAILQDLRASAYPVRRLSRETGLNVATISRVGRNLTKLGVAR